MIFCQRTKPCYFHIDILLVVNLGYHGAPAYLFGEREDGAKAVPKWKAGWTCIVAFVHGAL